MELAILNYEKRGGADLIEKNLFHCHKAASQEKIQEVVSWFAESREHNIKFLSHHQKQNRDVYMIALRDEEGNPIGYYEKHEYRNLECCE